MKEKEIKAITEPFRRENVTHLFLARSRSGIHFSSIANEKDVYDFLQVMIDTEPKVLDILEAVVKSRKKPKKPIVIN